MIKHGMDIQQQITSHLNPGQIPITTFDQPLFALAKTVQWRWPESHGEKTHVVMFGGLHIEMALWTTLGDLLDSSGWTTALCEAGIATSGTADSFLKASHLTRTRHSHQVTLLALSKLQHEASIWAMSLPPEQNPPIPEGYGWTLQEEVWKPIWTLLPEIAKASQELLKCGCNALPLCSRKCKCKDAGLSCTALCHCSGSCDS